MPINPATQPLPAVLAARSVFTFHAVLVSLTVSSRVSLICVGLMRDPGQAKQAARSAKMEAQKHAGKAGQCAKKASTGCCRAASAAAAACREHPTEKILRAGAEQVGKGRPMHAEA